MDADDLLAAGCLILGIVAFVATLLLPVAVLIWVVLQW